MQTHPEIDDIIVYAEDPSTSPRKEEIEEHLMSCTMCLLDVSAYRNLRDLEREGLLINPADRAAEPSLVVKQYLKENAKPGAKKTGILTALGGTLAAGLFSLSSTPHAEPAFAGQSDADGHDSGENNSSTAVSSEGVGPSFYVEPTEMHVDHEIHKADPVIGTPAEDSSQFPGKQSYTDTCAIRCQEYIIRQYTGLDLPEKFYVDEAKTHGWYHPGGGTTAAEIGNLLELHNIPVHRYYDANILNLTAELAQGHKVIVGVHADDLWSNDAITRDFRQALGFAQGDHAVVVTGIDTHHPDHVEVIVSDPGTGEVAAHYPIEQFISAWREAHFYMVSTQTPPPAEMHLPEMEHFDYQAGHIQHVGELPYEAFQHLVAEQDLHAHDPGWAESHRWSEELVSKIGVHEPFEPSSETHHHDFETVLHHTLNSEHTSHSDEPYHHDETGENHHIGHEADHSHDSGFEHGDHDLEGPDES